jgi:hypothetical protein
MIAGFGLGTAILGLVTEGLRRSQPAVSADASRSLWQAAIYNLAALIEECGLEGQAVYLPARIGGAKGRALIPAKPLDGSVALPAPMPSRLIVRLGRSEIDMALLVATPAGELVEVDHSAELTPDELEALVHSLLVSTLGLARSVRVVQEEGGARVELGGPMVAPDLVAQRVLGSPAASAAAALLAEAWDSPVFISEEAPDRGSLTITLRRLE